jgi:hypothetical protein
MDHSPEKKTKLGGTRTKEKEFEESVVVLVAKVEIPRPMKPLIQYHERQQGRLHRQPLTRQAH